MEAPHHLKARLLQSALNEASKLLHEESTAVIQSQGYRSMDQHSQVS